LSDYDASVIIDNKEFALYFEELSKLTTNHKAAANWMMGDVKSYLNENAVTIEQFPLKPANIADIIALIDSGKVNYTIASQRIFPALLKEPAKTAADIAKEHNLVQESDAGVLEEFIQTALAKYPEKVIEYKNGKASLLGLFMGEIMKLSKGKADAKKATQLLKEALEK
jgi:aspartyl-tRNA(Asn)/glutamyl-tRNA(Gln) amidotransferase subunit B